jgi:rhodanese-related sulfurtransferase
MEIETKKEPIITYDEILMTKGTPEDRWVFVDIRPLLEFMEGHIPGSINIPVTSLDRYLPALRARAYHKTIVIVGDQDRDTQYAFDHLEAKLFGEVLILKGGLDTYKKVGEPLSRGAGKFSIERQARFVYGAMGLVGVILSMWHPLWLLLPTFTSLGLILDGYTGVCPLEMVLGRLPFNRK